MPQMMPMKWTILFINTHLIMLMSMPMMKKMNHKKTNSNTKPNTKQTHQKW